MFVNWNSLPAEIWSSIFDHARNRKELAECRLVCKAWDPHAERAMFGQVLYLDNIDIVTEMCYHLVKKPFLGRCIKYIRFTKLKMESLPFHRDLLKLTVTPSIISLEGIINNESYKIMLDIAQGSDDRFNRLVYLPLLPTFHKSIHIEMALHFQKTSKELVLSTGFEEGESYQRKLMPLQPLLNCLDAFKSLNSLTIDFSVESKVWLPLKVFSTVAFICSNSRLVSTTSATMHD